MHVIDWLIEYVFKVKVSYVFTIQDLDHVKW